MLPTPTADQYWPGDPPWADGLPWGGGSEAGHRSERPRPAWQEDVARGACDGSACRDIGAQATGLRQGTWVARQALAQCRARQPQARQTERSCPGMDEHGPRQAVHELRNHGANTSLGIRRQMVHVPPAGRLAQAAPREVAQGGGVWWHLRSRRSQSGTRKGRRVRRHPLCGAHLSA